MVESKSDSTYGLLCELKDMGILEKCVRKGLVKPTLVYKKQIYDTFLKENRSVSDTSKLLDVDINYIYKVVYLFER